MQLVEHYSHLNGLEYLQVHRPSLWEEVQEVIAAVDAEACKTKISQEQRTLGETFYSPSDMNKAFTSGFKSRKWAEQRNSFWVTADRGPVRQVLLRCSRPLRQAPQLLCLRHHRRGHRNPAHEVIGTADVVGRRVLRARPAERHPSGPRGASRPPRVDRCSTLTRFVRGHGSTGVAPTSQASTMAMSSSSGGISTPGT